MRIQRFLASCVAWAMLAAAVLVAGQSNPDANKAATARMRQIWPNLPPNQDPAAVVRGKQLFSANCTFCHGADATGGNGGPDLIRSVLVNHDEHGNLIGPVIHGARVDKGMPKFDLTDPQVTDLVAFLHQRNRDARIRFTYKIADVAVGDAAAGKQYFKVHCSGCHSPAGDLAKIATRYPADVIQQLWLNPAGAGQLLPPSQVTVAMPSGQLLSGRLQHLNEFNVSFYSPDGLYHSLPVTPGMKIAVNNPLAAHEELLKQITDTDMHNVTTYLETLK